MINNIMIKVLAIPDGNTCRYEDGFYCPKITTQPESGQKWCSVFDQKLSKNNETIFGIGKCQNCREVTEKLKGGKL